MKKRLSAVLVLILSVYLLSVPAFASDTAYDESIGVGGGAGTTENPTPDIVVQPGGSGSSESSGTGAGSVGGGAVTSYGGSEAESSLFKRVLNSLAQWIRGRFAPWMQSIALPWLTLNWKWVAIVCGALIALRLLIGVFSRTSRKRSHRGND